MTNNYFGIKIGSVNIQSGKEMLGGSKMYTVCREISERNIHICGLQEVRYRNSGKKVIDLDNGESYTFMWSGPKKRRLAGVGLLIKNCKEISFDVPDFLDLRIIAVNIMINGFKLRLINSYSPTNCDGSDIQKDLFYRMLKKACTKHNKHQKLVILGDFNATTSISLHQSYFDGKNVVEDPNCNDNGSRIKSFCREKQLCMSQTFFDHPIEERYTWESPNKNTKKVLDYILVEPYIQNFVSDCYVDQKITFETDHHLVLAEISLPITKKSRRIYCKPTTPTKVNIKALHEQETKLNFLPEITKGIRINKREKTIFQHHVLINIMTKAADVTLPKLDKKNIKQENGQSIE